MITLPVHNQEGKTIGDMELSESVFDVAMKSPLVHQVYKALMANAREPWADTKDRGEVRGGGKKPWKQKGTGRARHGSIRSPIWKGGGVTFGPLSERNYTQKINKKMNKKAVAMCLSEKRREGKITVLEQMKSTGKTKEVAAFFAGLAGHGHSTLLIVPDRDDTIARATGNLPRVALGRADDVSVVDLLHHQYLIITKTGIERLEKRLALT